MTGGVGRRKMFMPCYVRFLGGLITCTEPPGLQNPPSFPDASTTVQGSDGEGNKPQLQA